MESNVDFLSIVLIAAAGLSAVSAFGSWSGDGFGEQRTVFSRTTNTSRLCSQKGLAAVTLQLAFLTSELALNTPLSRLASRVLSVSPVGLVSHLAPVGAMFGIAAVWGQLERIGGIVVGILRLDRAGKDCRGLECGVSPTVSPAVTTLTNESLSKYNSGEHAGAVNANSCEAVAQHGRAESYSSISPHESWSSQSSGDLSNGMPSPTGVVREAGNVGQKAGPSITTVNAYDAGLERAYMEAMGLKSDGHTSDGRRPSGEDGTIYLFKYDVAGVEDSVEQTDQGCLFVHKKLSPIKTRVADVAVTATYRPLLRTLIQQGKDKDCRHIPAVRSVARGEGEARVEGMRMLPCKR